MVEIIDVDKRDSNRVENEVQPQAADPVGEFVKGAEAEVARI